MGLVHTFISELLADFVDSVKTTDNQHLQVEFRSDSHEKIKVQVIVMGDEWLGISTTSNHIHHWGFNLNEAHIIKESSDILDHLGSGDEDVSGSVVHDKIKISLSVSGFVILKTGLSGRKHVQAVTQKLRFRGSNTEFTSFGSTGVTLDTKDITSSNHSVEFIEVSTNMLVSIGHNLDSLAIALKIVENELSTLLSDVGNTTSNGDSVF
mmetsp:Transcript_27788/g.24389  ORF Transcript_27788/g.24389 Transcript_27788/m.24389 type:complete len:209 (-) Transcript_27788:431-1057(-)